MYIYRDGSLTQKTTFSRRFEVPNSRHPFMFVRRSTSDGEVGEKWDKAVICTRIPNGSSCQKETFSPRPTTSQIDRNTADCHQSTF